MAAEVRIGRVHSTISRRVGDDYEDNPTIRGEDCTVSHSRYSPSSSKSPSSPTKSSGGTLKRGRWGKNSLTWVILALCILTTLWFIGQKSFQLWIILHHSYDYYQQQQDFTTMITLEVSSTESSDTNTRSTRKHKCWAVIASADRHCRISSLYWDQQTLVAGSSSQYVAAAEVDATRRLKSIGIFLQSADLRHPFVIGSLLVRSTHVNDQLNLSLNFSGWIKSQRPTLGMYPTFRQMPTAFTNIVTPLTHPPSGFIPYPSNVSYQVRAMLFTSQEVYMSLLTR